MTLTAPRPTHRPATQSALESALAQFDRAMLVEAGLLIAVEDKEPYDRFRDRLIFPVRDSDGRTVALLGRAVDPTAIN